MIRANSLSTGAFALEDSVDLFEILWKEKDGCDKAFGLEHCFIWSI